MKPILFATSLIFLLSPFGAAFAQDYPQRLATMGNENPAIVDSMNARCSSEDEGETLDCILTTTSIDYALSADDASARVDNFFRFAELANSLDSAIDNLFDESQCSSVFDGKIDSPDSPLASQYRDSLTELCAAEPNVENARKVLELQTEIEIQTCKIWGSSGGISLNRSDATGWNLQTEPEGLCDVYEVFELQCDAETMYYCEYDEHAIYGKKTGQYCEGFEDVIDEGDHYSSDITMNFEMPCSFLQFTY